MGTFVQTSDLAPFATIDTVKAAAMIEDAEAQAILVAPCLASLTTAPDGETPDAQTIRRAKVAAAKSIVRGAILRWNDAGTGAVTQTQVGPFGQQVTQQARRAMFYPSEIEQLQAVCKGTENGKAFSVDLVASSSLHSDTCALNFGASYCSCGVDVAGYPIFGLE